MTKAQRDKYNKECLIQYMKSKGINEEDFDTLPF